MKDHGALAETYFKQGYNCAQSVVMAFSEELGMDTPTAAKMAAGFGGGFGRMREVCGAFSGIVLVASTLYGNTDPAGKSAFYAETQQLGARFRECSGKDTLICRELLGPDLADDSPIAEKRTKAYYEARPCTGLVVSAAQIMEEYLAAHPLPNASS